MIASNQVGKPVVFPEQMNQTVKMLDVTCAVESILLKQERVLVKDGRHDLVEATRGVSEGSQAGDCFAHCPMIVIDC